jgi:tripartite-type tricarboxylate transporter receptor subunit TctC
MSHIRAGGLKAIAVTPAVRSPLLPDVPSFAESGVPRFDVIDWFGFLAPARTSPAIVSRLNAEINSVLQAASMQEQLRVVGFDVIGGTADAFDARIRSDVERWAKVVKASGAKVD